MSKASPCNENRIIACRENSSLDYVPKKVDLPVKESYFVQVGRGEHNVDVRMATVGNIGLLRLGIDDAGIIWQDTQS